MTQDIAHADLPKPRKKEIKAQARRAVLQTLPKGGLCLEVGVWRGDFTRMILNQLKPDKLILVDPWKSFDDRDAAFDGKTGSDKFEEIYRSVLRKYSKEIDSGQVEVDRNLSSDAFEKLGDETVSFVYLDGDHSYEGVTADLAHAHRIVKPGGFIMMDDYHLQGWWGDAVVRATNEYLGKYPQGLRVGALRGAQIAIRKL